MSGDLFLDFFYRLRAHRLPVSTHDWLMLCEALAAGSHQHTLEGFYQVARCILVTHENQYDGFDLAFSETFQGLPQVHERMLDHLQKWLEHPRRRAALDSASLAAMERLDTDTLRARFFERLAEQRERHEGGSKWIGTGGTSPFGRGGSHPSGVRIGGSGGGRSALAVADRRRFRGFRTDLVLDTRSITSALRQLRQLRREGAADELDLEGTVEATAKSGGDLDVVWRASRRNDLRLILMLDVGGSMDPHAQLVSQLFSAAYRGGGFRELRSYYFHNCVYGEVYEDASFRRAQSTAELIGSLDERWFLVFVGDAWMHPGELLVSSGDFWNTGVAPSGLTWLARLADRFPRAAWLNPEPTRIWSAPTIAEIGRIFPMLPLTLEGLEDMVKVLLRPTACHRSRIEQVLRG
ncbi:MAG: VWA domain-containing protein [Nannocystaceae bacterium]